MPSQLETLRERCAIALETADLALLAALGAHDAHLTITRVTAAAQLPEHAELVDAALRFAQRAAGKAGRRRLVAIRAVERLGIEFALRALAIVPGRVSVEIDPRLAFETGAAVDRARDLVRQVGDAGGDPARILVRLPATWEGLRAAQTLEQAGIACHIALVFGMAQLEAAADAAVRVVSPAVGRISDFHAKRLGVAELRPEEDPAVALVHEMRAHLATRGCRTELCPAMFRTSRPHHPPRRASPTRQRPCRTPRSTRAHSRRGCGPIRSRQRSCRRR
jgi:transaldolase